MADFMFIMLLMQQESSVANFYCFITSKFFHTQEKVLYQLKAYFINLHLIHNKCHVYFCMQVALVTLFAYNTHSFNFKSLCRFMAISFNYHSRLTNNCDAISFNYHSRLTNNCDGKGSTITSNRISYSTCVCSTITCSNIINGVVSMEHCTSSSMIHCSDTSGLLYCWIIILPPCECVWGRTS